MIIAGGNTPIACRGYKTTRYARSQSNCHRPSLEPVSTAPSKTPGMSRLPTLGLRAKAGNISCCHLTTKPDGYIRCVPQPTTRCHCCARSVRHYVAGPACRRPLHCRCRASPHIVREAFEAKQAKALTAKELCQALARRDITINDKLLAKVLRLSPRNDYSRPRDHQPQDQAWWSGTLVLSP